MCKTIDNFFTTYESRSPTVGSDMIMMKRLRVPVCSAVVVWLNYLVVVIYGVVEELEVVSETQIPLSITNISYFLNTDS